MDISNIRARDIMKRDVIKVLPDMKLADLAKLLDERHISGVPVVDRSNKLIGVVSQTDIIRFYATFPQNKQVNAYFRGDDKDAEMEAADTLHHAGEILDDFGQRKVEEIMTRETFAFNDGVSVIDIAKAMIKLHMHRVIIIDEDFNLAGVVSTMDLVNLLANGDNH